MNIDKQKIIDIFHTNNIDWYVNIFNSYSKSLEYSPLHDEISLDSSVNISTKVTIIKNHKKASFSIDWYSLDKIESSIKELLKVIDFWEYDEDIVLADITDNISKDFWNTLLNDIWFDKLEEEFLKFKNYKFAPEIKIEWFEINVTNTTQTFINSLGSIKTQSDNESSIAYVLFWEKWDLREDDYEVITKKSIPEVLDKDIEKLQTRLLNKIKPSDSKLETWNYNVVLDREVVIDFLEILVGSLWSESMREWTSLLSRFNIWDKVISDKITITNNPTLEWYTWNLLFDKEWVTQEKRVLFDAWVLSSKFYDYKNAKKEWLDKLWNSTVSNIELIWETSSNIYTWCDILITHLMAYHTLDNSTWKFSLNWEWYLIEDWKKWAFIKNISLSGDIINLFSSVIAIWDDFKSTWNYKVPSLSFRDQHIIW